MSRSLCFSVPDGTAFEVVPTRLVVAGWTGRDAAAIEHHIEELGRLGVPRPSAVPLYYRLARSLLTQDSEVEVLGPASSGEAEPVLVRYADRWWLTVGSDHTDRAAEAYSVAVSKQMCAKPVATAAWPWDEVAAHADALTLHAEIFENERWTPYQEGALASIRPLQSLIDGLPGDVVVADGLVLFCGTLAAIADAAGTAVRPAERMRIALADPRRSRRLAHEYRTVALPQVA